jgi:hypothetical protein
MLVAKVTSNGLQWRSRFIAFGVLAYKMEAVESNSRSYAEVEPIEVRPADGGGWDVLLYGDAVHHEQYKRDAQHEAAKLLDNPTDSYGYPLQNTGRRYFS